MAKVIGITKVEMDGETWTLTETEPPTKAEILNDIAQAEFGIDYENLGVNEKEWCDDEKIYRRN